MSEHQMSVAEHEAHARLGEVFKHVLETMDAEVKAARYQEYNVSLQLATQVSSIMFNTASGAFATEPRNNSPLGLSEEDFQ